MKTPETYSAQPSVAVTSELAERVTPELFVGLHIAVRGYTTSQSSELQGISRDKAGSNLRQLTAELGASTLAQAAAISLNVGILPDPAHQENEKAPEEVELDDTQVMSLRLAMDGLRQQEIASRLGMGGGASINSCMSYMYGQLQARNVTQAVWRGFQVGLFRPARPQLPINPEHAERLRQLETALGKPITALGRKSSVAERKEQDRQRHEKALLSLLATDSFAIYHPEVGAHIRATWGYDLTQWRKFTNDLGPNGANLIRLVKVSEGQAAHGLELNDKPLQTNQPHPLLTVAVRETYARRVEEMGITRMGLFQRRSRQRRAAAQTAWGRDDTESNPSLIEKGKRRTTVYIPGILSLLETDSFAVYDSRVGAYVRAAWGYDLNQWRNFISKVGPGGYNLVRLVSQPGAQAAHGLELNDEMLRSGDPHSKVTAAIRETYDRRVEEMGVRTAGELDARRKAAAETALSQPRAIHPLLRQYNELDPQERAALPPAVRITAALVSPMLRDSFSNQEELLRNIATISGQEVEKIGPVLGLLNRHRSFRLSETEEGRLRPQLLKYGEQVLEGAIHSGTPAT